MKRELTINRSLLDALIEEVRKRHLPVHIQRNIPYPDENGTEQEDIIIEHPDTDFDFNAVLGRVINEHYNLKES